MPLPILQHPHWALRAVCEPITEFGQPVRAIADAVYASLRAADAAGIGLAANQVGITKRLVVLDPSAKGLERIVLVNPVIVRREGSQKVNDGCLSVNGGRTFRVTTRAARIRVEYQDEGGNHRKMKAQSHFAAIIQHELDHLDGVLFIDLEGKAA